MKRADPILSGAPEPERNISAELIEAQLRRIQSTAQFTHSRRYSKLLSHVVHKAITGQQDELKERIIGIECFGRSPDYDLSTDPVVRVSAGEVRKRLAQYYYDAERQTELRIELHAGSYVPEFRWAPFTAPQEEEACSVELLSTTGEAPALPTTRLPSSRSRFHTRWMFGAGMLLLLVLLASLGIVLRINAGSGYKQFWRPIVKSHSPVLIVVGSATAFPIQMPRDFHASSFGGHPLSSYPVVLDDSLAVSKIAQALANQSRSSNVQSAFVTTFSDLQKGPVVLVSGFNNPWTMRLTDSLRFHFVRTDVSEFEIQDRTDPVHRRWAVNTLLPFSDSNHDFALVARYHDPTTDQIVVVAAGIGDNGTLVAGEMLSNLKYLDEFTTEGVLPRSYRNMEAVLETKMIDGQPGPPHIVAVHTW